MLLLYLPGEPLPEAVIYFRGIRNVKRVFHSEKWR